MELEDLCALYYHQASEHDKALSVSDNFSILWSWQTVHLHYNYIVPVCFLVLYFTTFKVHFSFDLATQSSIMQYIAILIYHCIPINNHPQPALYAKKLVMCDNDF